MVAFHCGFSGFHCEFSSFSPRVFRFSAERPPMRLVVGEVALDEELS
jgi:hypothetical protein